MKSLLFLNLLICLISCSTKNSELVTPKLSHPGYTLKGTVKAYHHAPYYMYGFHGFQSQLVDSGYTGPAGEFEQKLPANLPAGLYRIVFRSTVHQKPAEAEPYLDFIFNKENIEFSTSMNFLHDSLKIISSKENKGFYEYLRQQDLYNRKMNVLTQFLFYYPEKDNFQRRLEKQVKRLKNRHANYTENLIKKNEGLMFSKIMKILKTPRVPDKHPENRTDEYIRAHFLSNTSFNDTFLLRTPYIPEKVLSYISLYRNNQLDEEMQEEEYIRAMDTVMTKASVNDEVFLMLSEYLVNGFESLGMYAVSEYVTTQYILGGPCEVEDIPANLLAKAIDIQKLAIGMPAPDFSFATPEGKEYWLHDIAKEYTLLIFWTTNCPHCADMMPRLKTIADEYRLRNPGYFEVLAISLDPEKGLWESFVKEKKLDFIHTADFRGWESPAARLYNINASPMLFLLDSNKNIVLKPNRMRQLERFLKKNLP